MAGTPKFHKDMAMLERIPEDMIFSMIEAGKAHTDICNEVGISKKALNKWLDDVDPDGDKIARARARASHEYAMETLQIADSSDAESAAQARIRIQARQWVAERWNPKTYGQQKAAQLTVNIQDMRLAALRHVEVVEDLSTDQVPKLSTD